MQWNKLRRPGGHGCSYRDTDRDIERKWRGSFDAYAPAFLDAWDKTHVHRLLQRVAVAGRLIRPMLVMEP